MSEKSWLKEEDEEEKEGVPFWLLSTYVCITDVVFPFLSENDKSNPTFHLRQ